jgi:ribosomal protein L7Ae-like RNA K-turn-binding protein
LSENITKFVEKCIVKEIKNVLDLANNYQELRKGLEFLIEEIEKGH